MPRAAAQPSSTRTRRYEIWHTGDVSVDRTLLAISGRRSPKPSWTCRRNTISRARSMRSRSRSLSPVARSNRVRGTPHHVRANECADRPVCGTVLLRQYPAEVRMPDRATGPIGAARARPGCAVWQRPPLPDLPPAGTGYERCFVLAAARSGGGAVSRPAGARYPPGVGPSLPRPSDRGDSPRPQQ